MTRAEFNRRARKARNLRQKIAALEDGLAKETAALLTAARDDDDVPYSVGAAAEQLGITRSTAYDVYLTAKAA